MTDVQLNVVNQKQAMQSESVLNRRLLVGPVPICLLLVVITFAVYWPVTGYDFINYDDPDYVTSNPHVQSGLSSAGVIWAFTTRHASNWHPLTWLSHMMDCQFFGLRSGWHHLINLMFHAANAVLVFTLFRHMTGALWRSAFVAALFALHPLHVESVAWISERKDVLSTFFGLVSLLFYAQYAKSEVRNTRAAIRDYFLAWFLFACSLMSKPMLVTLPFVMLLLDYWPLARFGQGATFWRFVSEKIPFLILSATSSYVTVVAQQAGGAVMPLSIGARIANALISYACYVRDTFWPKALALPYPHPGEWPMVQVIVATIFVLGISAVVVWFGRRRPYLFWGWTWFLGTMIPVIGLLQVGGQARADRYTYIPLIGVFVIISWGLGDLLTKWRWKTSTITTCATLILAACALRTSDQLAYWSNTELLFRRTLSVTKDNYLALKYLGFQFASEGRLDEALAYYRESLRIRPGFGDTLNDLGNVLVQKKQYAEAEDQFQSALRADPGFLPAHYNFGNLLITLGRTNEAIEHFETVLRSKSDHSATRYQLGCVMAASGHHQEAITQFETLLQSEPDYPDARHRLGSVLSDRGEWDDAIRQLRLAAKQKPDAPDIENDLAVALSKRGSFDEAIIHFRRVSQLSPNVASVHNNLANALVEAGKLSEAMREYNEALQLNPNAFMTHVNMAFLLVKLDRQDEAIFHLTEALRLKPDCEQAKEQLRKMKSQSPN